MIHEQVVRWRRPLFAAAAEANLGEAAQEADFAACTNHPHRPAARSQASLECPARSRKFPSFLLFTQLQARLGDMERCLRYTVQASSSSRRQRTALYLSFFLCSGALVGAYGPSFARLNSTVGLSLSAFGDGTSFNRAAKVVCTMLWKLDRLSAHPHRYIAIGLACMSLSAAMFASATDVVSVQLSMLVGGGGTGLAGTGCQLLLQWTWAGIAAEYARTAAAGASAAWTLGATVAPLLVALFWPALHVSVGLISGACAVVSLGVVLSRSPPRPGSRSAAAHDSSHQRDDRPAQYQRAHQKLEAAVEDKEVADRPAPPSAADADADADADTDAGAGAGADADAGEKGAQRLATLLTVVGGVLLLLCNATEHAVGTWLADYGVERCGATPSDMALLTSAFFSAQLIARLVWLLAAAHVPSTWPVLGLSSLTCVAGALTLSVAPFGGALCSTPRLVAGASLLGTGVAVSFPAVMALPAECGVSITAGMVTAISLFAYTGELLGPWLMSRALERSAKSFGTLVAAVQGISALFVLAGWRGVHVSRRWHAEWRG